MFACFARLRSIISMKLLLALLVVFIGYYWFHHIKRGPVCASNKSLKGKTALITGGNTGVGKATALELAKRGAKVLIASRNVTKSEFARQQLIHESKNKEVFALELDLGQFDNVRSFAQKLNKDEEYIDYLINNAGVADMLGRTNSGVNRIFAVNHFGHFLLTNLLIDKMIQQSQTRPVRIINLSSKTYKIGTISEELIYGDVKSAFVAFKTYAASKLANIYFTAELHNKLLNYNITTYAVNPGAVATELGTHYSWAVTAFLHYIFHPLYMRNEYYGSQTALYCALDDKVEEFSGDFFDECKREELMSHALNETIRKYLWSESLKVTGLKDQQY